MRIIPFEEDAICDFCGNKGAFDFFGDYACPECAAIMFSGNEEQYECGPDETTEPDQA